MSPTSIVAYLALFASVGFAFLFVSLCIGRLLRPQSPSAAKLATYECGEPSVGSSYVQFDLRYYVVALVFIIFDVEVAFFFPWATVFGKATTLKAQAVAAAASEEAAQGEAGAATAEALSPASQRAWEGLLAGASTEAAAAAAAPSPEQAQQTGQALALTAMLDIAVFFGVLMVGFAYVWYRGDLDWVRALPRRALGDSGAGESLAA